MLPFAWWGAGERGSVTRYLTGVLSVVATTNLLLNIIITESVSAAFGETLDRLTASRTTTVKPLFSELSATASTNMTIDRFITRSASVTIGETLDRLTASRTTTVKPLFSELSATASTNMTIDRFITRSASVTIGETLDRLTTSRITAAKTLSSGLSAAAASSLSLSRTITKSASAAFDESLAQSSVNALPAAPSGLTADESIGAPPDVDLAWTDNADDEDNYAVQRQDLNGSWGGWNNLTTTLPANTTEYTDTTTVADKTYRYRVYATNSRGSSGYSNIVQITTSEDA